jgi:hypothetical protein
VIALERRWAAGDRRPAVDSPNAAVLPVSGDSVRQLLPVGGMPTLVVSEGAGARRVSAMTAADADRLELEEYDQFQRWEWRLQRLGWLIWATLLGAGLAGLLGPGPLSRQTATSRDGSLTIVYDKYVHFQHPITVEATMLADGDDQELRLHLSRSLLDRVQIERIEPTPAAERLTPDGIQYDFSTAPGATRVKAAFHVVFEKIGVSEGQWRLQSGAPVVVSQLVYP